MLKLLELATATELDVHEWKYIEGKIRLPKLLAKINQYSVPGLEINTKQYV